MGCLYCNFEGVCDFYPEDLNVGVDENGFCVVEEDPNPEDSCCSYQSMDMTECSECGQTSENIDECEYCGYCFHCAMSECECEWE